MMCFIDLFSVPMFSTSVDCSAPQVYVFLFGTALEHFTVVAANVIYLGEVRGVGTSTEQ